MIILFVSFHFIIRIRIISRIAKIQKIKYFNQENVINIF